LLSVSEKYGTPMADILLWNDINDVGMLQSGMHLLVRKNTEDEGKMHAKQEELERITGGLAGRLFLHAQQGNGKFEHTK
jgi:hypothetical protein